MKKTLIALAVAASAVVSGSAMAADWVPNGNGSSVNIGGTLTPNETHTPWEVKIGDTVTNLNGEFPVGTSTVSVFVDTAVKVLGIRTQSSDPFDGVSGISPQISFNNAVNLDSFNAGSADLTLDVQKSEDSQKIGTLSGKLYVGAQYSVKGKDEEPTAYKYVMYASKAGDAFFGGLPKSKEGSAANPHTNIQSIDGEITSKFNDQGGSWGSDNEGYGSTDFATSTNTYSAYYGAGILSGSELKINLDSPATSDEINWKATLPVTVSYQ